MIANIRSRGILVVLLSSILCALGSAQAIKTLAPDLPKGYDYKKPLTAKQIIAVKDEMLQAEIGFLKTWIGRAKKDAENPRTKPEDKVRAQKKMQAYQKSLSLRQKDLIPGASQKARLQTAKTNFARWRTELRRRIGIKETEINRLKGRTGERIQPTIRELKIEIAELQGYEKSLMRMERTVGTLIAKA